jgi:uncharacterized protein
MSYLLDIRGLFESLSASRTVSDTIDMPEVRLGAQSYAPLGPATFTVTLTNTGAGVVADGEVAAEFRTSCVRCLCEFDLRVTAPVDGFFIQPGREETIPEEQEFDLIIEGVRIDLEPTVTQALIVELPFAPVHDARCKGICPVCGADRNATDCGCEQATGAPSRFAVLRELLDTPPDEYDEG